MTKQYKINEGQFSSHKEKNIRDYILFAVLFIIGPLAIGLYNHQTTPLIWLILFLGLSSVYFQIISDFFLGRKNKRTLLEGYSITFSNTTIAQKIPVPKSSLINSQPVPLAKEIHYDNISAIKKTGNDSFIIIGKEGNPSDIIAIPAHMENYAALEKELEKLHPITKFNTDLLEQTFSIPKGGFKKFQFYFLSRIIPIILIMLLLLIVLLNPDTYSDWKILGIVLSFFLVAIFWAFSNKLKNTKSEYNSYRLTIDKQLVIQEQKGLINIIPINEIVKIKKLFGDAYSIIWNRGKTDKKFWRSILIPAQIENKKALEMRLNSILPIAQSRFFLAKK